VQSLKDAATLATLILLALTVRIAPLEGALELGQIHAASLLPIREKVEAPIPATDSVDGITAPATLACLTRFSTEPSAAPNTEGSEEPCPPAAGSTRISFSVADVVSMVGDFEGVRRIARRVADEQFVIILDLDVEALPDVDPAPALSSEPAETCESLARRTC
jgi:hypothetical protein